MAHKIFLSHKYEDKPVVEQVALKLREIFGEDAVFYDAWSIKPGDGIIEKMNEGLKAPEFVFFFVSQLSLQSGLVKIEWQNALLKASKGETRLIPVRIGNVALPDVLRQSLYIDMYQVGLEVAVNQIVNVVQGNSSFTPQHIGFSNLTARLEKRGSGILVTIAASHLMEPNPEFGLLIDNEDGELKVTAEPEGGMHREGFNARPFGPGEPNVYAFAPIGGAITPERPLRFVMSPIKDGVEVKLRGILHGWSAPFRDVPIIA